jgi:hypothetical protein
MTEVIGGIAQVMGLGRDVALLIDGDNIPSRFAGQVITQAVRLGSVTVKRVYGRIGGLTDWQGSTGFRLIHGGTGKNAADMQLTIDAVELFHRGYRSTISPLWRIIWAKTAQRFWGLVMGGQPRISARLALGLSSSCWKPRTRRL